MSSRSRRSARRAARASARAAFAALAAASPESAGVIVGSQARFGGGGFAAIVARDASSTAHLRSFVVFAAPA